MNKRQKLVQETFLNNEKVIISRLKKVYDKALEDISRKGKELQDEINMLDVLLNTTEDETARATLKSMQQSKIYQKQYQDALKKQIGSILDNMQVEEFKTVSEYLRNCYEDGFIGTMYDLHGQGIPFIFPIDQEAMIRAVQIDSKISQGLYTRLGEDITLLKRKIVAQVSRGISTGMSYEQVAQQLSAYTKIGFNNAVRIARTEGHRIQVQSGMDACYKAKENGADVVKQWDSSLDKDVRKSHREVDGEIRELDEPFSNGLMFPSDPNGSASEVINCRCALLQRAKWALDEDELNTLKERASFYGLDKNDSFEDFKKKYLKAAEETPIEKPIEKPQTERTAEEDNALEWYVSGDGMWINDYLRGRGDFGTLSDIEEELLGLMTQATDRPLPDNMTKLYRSVDATAIFGNIDSIDWYNFVEYMQNGADSFGKGAYADGIRRKSESILNKVKGKSITEKGFMSTSKEYDVAAGWGDFSGAEMPVVLEFDIPNGTKGADLFKFEIEGDEQYEVLLAKGTKYEIADISTKDGQIYIKAKVLL